MRVVLTIEAIGDTYAALYKQLQIGGGPPFDRRSIDALRFGNHQKTAWVRRFGEVRTIQPLIDYSNANANGNSGIILTYFLEPGVYEVNEPLAIGKARSYCLLVDSDAREITKEEAQAIFRRERT